MRAAKRNRADTCRVWSSNFSANRTFQRVAEQVGCIINAILLALICAQLAAGAPTRNQQHLNQLNHSAAAWPTLDESSGPFSRVKREAERKIPLLDASNWSENKRANLSYRIVNYPTLLKEKMVDDELADAFAVWSSGLHVDFTPTKEAGGKATFEIEFVAKEKRHKVFPGWPKISPTSSFVRNGTRVILFDDQDWTATEYLGYEDFRNKITVHEIGHALGLKHDEVSSMRDCVGRMSGDLTNEDKLELAKIFGARAVVSK